jgi:transposase-like protein
VLRDVLGMGETVVTDEPATNGNDWTWTPKREAVAYALSQGKSYRDAAKECDVGVTTITRWVKVPAFNARIDELHDQVVLEARRILKRNAAIAALKVVQIAEAGYGQHAVKLSASKDILDRVGVRAPDKLALTDPSGENEYGGLSDRELTAKLVSLLDAARARAGGETDP